MEAKVAEVWVFWSLPLVPLLKFLVESCERLAESIQVHVNRDLAIDGGVLTRYNKLIVAMKVWCATYLDQVCKNHIDDRRKMT